jgi:SAM-dependent methyltransferase
MDPTDRYYEEFAAEFFGSTVGVDMTPIHQRFLARLEPRSHILDAGCGSGRDAKAFAEAGFRVSAFDASAELAKRASAHCGFEVATRRFEDIDEVAQFDGIWCCASLLHVPLAEIPDTFARLWRALRPGGTLYVSFKHGQGERVHGGRRFTDADETLLGQWFGRLPEVCRLEMWLTDDQRPDRPERWTNALATRRPTPIQRLVTGGTDHFLPHLSEAFASATQADLAVAFIKATGLRLLLPDLESMVDASAPRQVRVLTSDYLDITDPEALRLLLLLQERGAEVRVQNTRFTIDVQGQFDHSGWKRAQSPAVRQEIGLAAVPALLIAVRQGRSRRRRSNGATPEVCKRFAPTNSSGRIPRRSRRASPVPAAPPAPKRLARHCQRTSDSRTPHCSSARS